VRLSWDDPTLTFARVIEAAGEIPVPPYLNRASEPCDSRDYQTVYSHVEGSVAAPTAGLHFTQRLLEALDRRGIERAEVTLHVGAGTFQPVKTEHIGDHEMHSEFIVVHRELIEKIATTTRIIAAVGTTSVRTLESLYHIGILISRGEWTGELLQWTAYEDNQNELTVAQSMQAILDWLDRRGEDRIVASTRIIIAPGYRYRVVRAMVTNFHQPGSTLLLLVSAFIGDAWHQVYDYAMRNDYRFLSYGDACLFFDTETSKLLDN
jgi:S-adenosylmethionine:tRNA ribosyltransferase-isomerase